MSNVCVKGAYYGATFVSLISGQRPYTLCPKKVVHQTHEDNFVNSQQIFKILSQLESHVNLQ